MSNFVLDGIMGLCVADALGVPVEFMNRETLRKDPVVGMREYGTYNQPTGTWSDDTSMTLCLVDSLSKGLDYEDIMLNFIKWIETGEYTPYGEAFDIGITTRKALMSFKNGISPLECGRKSEHDNGNGSLMRILPILFYLQSIYGMNFTDIDGAYEIIHNISSLTHGHRRSQIACGIYILVASELVESMCLETAVRSGIYSGIEYYGDKKDYIHELRYFERLSRKDFAEIPEEKIKSSGYVVDTLEAAIWCLLNTDNYRDCVLKAVNLGNDTDTVAAVAGGLAGLKYGYSSIPQDWVDEIARKEYVEDLCNELYLSLVKNSIEKLSHYIPYFETATKESVCHWGGGEKLGENQFTMPYPIYDDTLVEFIEEFYKTNLISYDYLDVIESRGLKSTNEINNAIDYADIELVKAILTGYVRQERFCDGIWVDAVRDKVFLKILKRFCELLI